MKNGANHRQTTERTDRALKRILSLLAEEYQTTHPNAIIQGYRGKWRSLHVRIIDPAFRGLRMAQRFDRIWTILEKLPEKELQRLSSVVPVTPQEALTSANSLIFDENDPVRDARARHRSAV